MDNNDNINTKNLYKVLLIMLIFFIASIFFLRILYYYTNEKEYLDEKLVPFKEVVEENTRYKKLNIDKKIKNYK